MSISPIIALLLCGSCSFVGAAIWDYKTPNGLPMTEEWINAGFNLCGGARQSPVDIKTLNVPQKKTKPFEFATTVSGSVTNNGHTLQLTLDQDVRLSGGPLSTDYKLLQIHFHWGQSLRDGTEHRINGEQQALEIHMVHMKTKFTDVSAALRSTEKDALAVIGILAQVNGQENQELAGFFQHAERMVRPNEIVEFVRLPLATFLPSPANRRRFYNYQGSLTTPTCDEVVDWYLMEDVVGITQKDLGLLGALEDANGETIKTNVRDVMRIFNPTDPPTSPVILYEAAQDSANDLIVDMLCRSCLERDNQRDYFADPRDCKRYLQCYRNGSSTARSCPPQQFWRDSWLTCVPDLKGECTNVWQAPPQVGISPVTALANGSCVDGWGTVLDANLDPTDPEAKYYYKMGTLVKRCGDNTKFSLTACMCVHSEEHIWPRQREDCVLYLPFEDITDPWRDETIHQRNAAIFGDVKQTDGFSGFAAEFSNGGRLEAPGMQTVDYSNHASFCFFYLCNDCDGGLVSNSGTPVDWSVRFGLTRSSPGNSILHGDTQLEIPQQTNLNSHDSVNSGQWVHVCGVLDNDDLVNAGQFTWNLYKDGVLVQSTATLGGDIKIEHCPLTLGTDHLYGNFTGRIDEVLICPYSFTEEDREAHRSLDLVHFNL